MLISLTTEGQMHAIGKAIRPLFADPVTNVQKANLNDESVVTLHCLFC